MTPVPIEMESGDVARFKKYATLSREILTRTPPIIHTKRELDIFWRELCTTAFYSNAGVVGRARINKTAAQLKPYVVTENCPSYASEGILRPIRKTQKRISVTRPFRLKLDLELFNRVLRYEKSSPDNADRIRILSSYTGGYLTVTGTTDLKILLDVFQDGFFQNMGQSYDIPQTYRTRAISAAKRICKTLGYGYERPGKKPRKTNVTIRLTPQDYELLRIQPGGPSLTVEKVMKTMRKCSTMATALNMTPQEFIKRAVDQALTGGLRI